MTDAGAEEARADGQPNQKGEDMKSVPNNCATCQCFRGKGISGTWGKIDYDQCWADPPDAQGRRSKVDDPPMTSCFRFTREFRRKNELEAME